MEWLTTMWTDNPLQVVIAAVLLWTIFTGGKVPDFLVQLIKPKPAPAPNPTPEPNQQPGIPQLIPILIQLIQTLQRRSATAEQGELDHMDCLVELGRYAEQCGDLECADKCHELLNHVLKMHRKKTV